MFSVSIALLFEINGLYSWKVHFLFCLHSNIYIMACHVELLTHLPPFKIADIFTDNIFRCIFVNEKICILIKISLKFVPKGSIDNNPALV